MSDNKTVIVNLLPRGIFIYFIYAALAWFVYGQDINAVVGVTIIAIILGLFIGFTSLIPIIGWIAAVVVSHFWLIPKLLIITGLEYTWLITAILIISSIGGLIITGLMTLAVIVLIFSIFG